MENSIFDDMLKKIIDEKKSTQVDPADQFADYGHYHLNGSCPRCGYCPCCGRGSDPWNKPYITC